MVVSLLANVSRCGMHDSRANGLTCLLGERGLCGGLSADHLGGKAAGFQDVQRGMQHVTEGMRQTARVKCTVKSCHSESWLSVQVRQHVFKAQPSSSMSPNLLRIKRSADPQKLSGNGLQSLRQKSGKRASSPVGSAKASI